jgi:hypothetical protein
LYDQLDAQANEWSDPADTPTARGTAISRQTVNASPVVGARRAASPHVIQLRGKAFDMLW